MRSTEAASSSKIDTGQEACECKEHNNIRRMMIDRGNHNIDQH